jgi:hypothetical protein
MKYIKDSKKFKNFKSKEELLGIEYKTKATPKNSKKYGLYYNNIGIIPSLSSIYGVREEDIEDITLKVVEVGVPDNTKNNKRQEYWGWYDNEKGNFSMIYPSWVQHFVCFTYGPKVLEENGKGYSVRFELVK